ncbi:MAG: hypothetical protein OXF09_04830 [Hyphomicrobiales bacterium]|nr:hypothetical protein [Hyphomicrobiales bacterium]MCY4038766.1 hypothetical protein [Hyphomicrobiales bacterium]
MPIYKRLYLIREAFETTIPELFADLCRKRKRKGVVEMVESEEGSKPAGLFLKMPVKKSLGRFTGLGKNLV